MCVLLCALHSVVFLSNYKRMITLFVCLVEPQATSLFICVDLASRMFLHAETHDSCGELRGGVLHYAVLSKPLYNTHLHTTSLDLTDRSMAYA